METDTIQESQPPSMSGGASRWSSVWAWICRFPLMLVILGHCLFSLGLWSSQVGFGEDTGPIAVAIANAPKLAFGPNLYIDLYTLIFAVGNPDPLLASDFMRFLVSLLTAVCLYLVLSRFRPALRIEAILFACFVWIASRINAPVLQLTSANGFAFSVMLLGIYCLFSPKRSAGLVGYLFFSLAAALLRPEWLAPFLLISLFLLGESIWKWIVGTGSAAGSGKGRRGLIVLAAAALALALTPSVLQRARPILQRADAYLLFGLGQCYASFSKIENPAQTFDPMTEYQAVLDNTFGRPHTLVEAIRNNPREAMRYFRLNTLNNLQRIPEALLSTRAGGRHVLLRERPQALMLYGVVVVGSICAFWRMRRGRTDASDSRRDILKKVVVMLLLCSGSSVAIVMLVGTPRYWISIVPLLYLGIAYCCSALMATVKSVRFNQVLVFSALLLFCRPNFLDLKGNNLEVHALRAIAPRVRLQPVIGALWADPLVVYAFRGEATGISAWDGIKAEDIAGGRFDILIIDRGFQASQTYASQRAFFAQFESEPARFGFQKFGDTESSSKGIYYRPAGAEHRN